MLSPEAKNADINLSVTTSEDSLTINTDASKLRDILVGLVSNSIRFTPAGGNISIRIDREDEDKGARIAITDDGIGISAEDQERVFDRFERGSHPDARRAGAGLGLSLVKSFVEMHGGWVSIDSRLDHGTSVMCTLPARAAPPPVC